MYEKGLIRGHGERSFESMAYEENVVFDTERQKLTALDYGSRPISLPTPRSLVLTRTRVTPA